jgi:hypothetical protein
MWATPHIGMFLEVLLEIGTRNSALLSDNS